MNIMTEQHKTFLYCLSAHIGKANAIHAKDLLDVFNRHTSDKIKETRTLRDLKEELNDFYGQCILSNTTDGYWIAQTYDEVLAYEKFLKSYSDNMFFQIKKVKENFTKKDGKQLSLV